MRHKRGWRAIVSGVGNGNGNLLVMGSIVNEAGHEGREVTIEIAPISQPWFAEAVAEYSRKLERAKGKTR